MTLECGSVPNCLLEIVQSTATAEMTFVKHLVLYKVLYVSFS